MDEHRGSVEGVLRVVQLNAGSLLEPGWPERREEIVAWLRRLDPDVVCLQEIWEDPANANTAGWLVDRLPEQGWHRCFAGAPFGPDLWPAPDLRFGSAVLSRWPIDEWRYHPLPIAPGDDDLFALWVPWELLHVRTAGLDVFSCHLASAPHHARHRRVQVLAIDDLIRAARGDLDASPLPGQLRDAMPPILCGDCNAEPDSDEMRFLASLAVLDDRATYYQDAWRVAGEGPGWTQDWRSNPMAASINVPRKRIDYVYVGDPFLRRGGAGRVLSARLAFDEPLTGVLASDHAGLVVDVVWPDRPDERPGRS
ncbi:MAG: endonuclease/exonuclease/phosphatase family protein [Acidimicrobiales bacterium]|nr:endonuclease/exonuclease/phosphatase family protein [Acidimicrobiales bacterium]